MLKRTLSLLALLLVMLPLAAFAGTVATRVMTTGGSISVNGGVAQTSANGTVSKFYSTAVDVAITPASGYTISKVTLNGVVQANTSPLTVPLQSASQNVAVSFAKKLANVTATATTGDGSISPYGTLSLYVNTSVTYTFSPRTGNSVISISGLPTGTPLVDADGNAATLPFPGPVKATFNVPDAGANIVAVFVPLAADAGAPQTVMFSKGTASATLSGTTSAPATYAWSQFDGPATATITGGSTLTPTVTVPAAGIYKLKLTATSGDLVAVAYTTVTATTSVTAAAKFQCVDCHTTAGIGPTVYPAWSASVHAQDPASICAGCHVGADDGSHPAPSIACVGCHYGAKIPAESTHTATANCVSCHTTTGDAHAAKFASAAHMGGTAFLKSQYVSGASLVITCADCHSNAANEAILTQFAQSAHGKPDAEAWRHYDWRTANRSSCARCHTGTGFVAKLGKENDASNVFLAADVLKPGEPLTCSACHTNAGTGELRLPSTQFTINMSNGATATYDVVGASTLCARCHSGRETGESIKADTDVTGVRGFVDSHYQPVTGIVYNKGGYQYAGQSYDSLGSHKLLGATGQGPCVTCHMTGKNHSFAAAACSTCHDVTVDAATLKANYDAALNNLKLALEGKGIYYGPVHPFFFKAPYVAGGVNTPFTNWGSVYGAASWKDTMGAAFNYNLLWSEKGAYAHNNAYAMKLIADSIDFLSDGVVGGP